MTLDYVKKVYEMRALQQRYFKERSSAVLQQCKQLEREVDNWTEMFMGKDRPTTTQQKLGL